MTLEFKITGMSCANCSNTVQNAVKKAFESVISV